MTTSHTNSTHSRTITALVQDKPGVLARISGLFRRRGFNIASLSVGHSERPGMSRMTFVVEGPAHVVRHVAAQLDRLIDVVEVQDITDRNFVFRELALIKVGTTPANRGSVLELVDIFGAHVVDVGAESLAMEITGDQAKIDALIELLRQYGVKEVMRTGRVAVLRGSLRSGGHDGDFELGWPGGFAGAAPVTTGAAAQDSGSV